MSRPRSLNTASDVRVNSQPGGSQINSSNMLMYKLRNIYFHCRTGIRIQTRIRTPSPMVTLYYAELFPLVRIQIQIPVRMVSRMVTVPILGTDLCSRDRSSPQFYYISIGRLESKSKPVEKFCIVQESVSVSESESVSGSGNKP